MKDQMNQYRYYGLTAIFWLIRSARRHDWCRAKSITETIIQQPRRRIVIDLG